MLVGIQFIPVQRNEIEPVTIADFIELYEPPSQSLETKSSSPIYFEIETLFWRKPEGTENTEVLELYVIPNLRSEYSVQYLNSASLNPAGICSMWI